jgi:hypothetical protein
MNGADEERDSKQEERRKKSWKKLPGYRLRYLKERKPTL